MLNGIHIIWCTVDIGTIKIANHESTIANDDHYDEIIITQHVLFHDHHFLLHRTTDIDITGLHGVRGNQHNNRIIHIRHNGWLHRNLHDIM